MTNRLTRACSRLAATLLLVLPAAGCGPALHNALVPERGYRVERDLACGASPRQRLDVYLPDGLADSAPVVVSFYGGSWQTSSKEQFRFVRQALASRGFVAVIPDYRLYPEVRFPSFVEDGAAALAWGPEPDRGARRRPASDPLDGSLRRSAYRHPPRPRP